MRELAEKPYLSPETVEEVFMFFARAAVASRGRHKGLRFLRSLAQDAARVSTVCSLPSIRNSPVGKARRQAQAEAAEIVSALVPELFQSLPRA